ATRHDSTGHDRRATGACVATSRRPNPLYDVLERIPRTLKDRRRTRAVVRAEPLEHRGAPGESATERDEQHFVTATQAALVRGLSDRDRDRRGRGVPVALDVHEDLLHREVQSLRDTVDDPEVR